MHQLETPALSDRAEAEDSHLDHEQLVLLAQRSLMILVVLAVFFLPSAWLGHESMWLGILVSGYFAIEGVVSSARRKQHLVVEGCLTWIFYLGILAVFCGLA